MLAYLVGLVFFFVSIFFCMLIESPGWGDFGEIVLRLCILGAGVVALLLHVFFGFLIGGRLDRIRGAGRDREANR